MINRETPPFVAYAIDRDCDLRTGRRRHEPLETERQLRPLRASAEAFADGRVIDGICVQFLEGEWHGFHLNSMLQAYGGLSAVFAACAQCPACAVRSQAAPPLAGCFGWLEFPAQQEGLAHQEGLAARIDLMLHNADLRAKIAGEFLATRPAWYGLWAHETPSNIQLVVHREIATRLLESIPDLPLNAGIAQSVRDWLSAVEQALQSGLKIHQTIVPGGIVSGRTWSTHPYCSRCHADRNVDRLANRSACAVCGLQGGVNSSRQRCARGRRPYQPLRLLLGPEAAAEWSIRLSRSSLSREPGIPAS